MATRDGIPFTVRCGLEGLPKPVAEYAFATHDGRRWRFDWAWPRELVALEVEGGVYTNGRHVRVKGFLSDLEKYNHAQCLGWIVLRCLPAQLMAAETFAWLHRAIAHRTAA